MKSRSYRRRVGYRASQLPLTEDVNSVHPNVKETFLTRVLARLSNDAGVRIDLYLLL